MKLFKTKTGHIISFGFDVQNRIQNPSMVSWSDPDGVTWEMSIKNEAGFATFDFNISPEFIRETNNCVIAYQPGMAVEMVYVGSPHVWSISILKPEQ